MTSASPLQQLARELVEKDPPGAARRIEAMDEPDAATVIGTLGARAQALIFPPLQVPYAAALLRAVEPEEFKVIVGKLQPERAASIFMHLPEDSRERFVPHLPEKVRRHVRDLLTYPDDSVGRLMSPRFLAMRQDMTVREAVRKIRTGLKKLGSASYAYVTGDDDVLVGVINMHDLLVAEPGTTLSSIMRREIFALPAFTPVEQAAEELARRRYFAAPVVDNESRILGIVRAEHLIRGAVQELGGDIQRMFGAGGDESAFSPVTYSMRKRLPWLHVNLATAFLAAGVVALFEPTIAKFTVLAVFLPVVAGQGGNAGAQSLAIVMRGLVLREIPRNRYRRLILKEGLLGLVSGVATGVVTAAVAWAWYGNPFLGLVIAMGMVVNLVSAGLAGASIPITLKAVGLDPAQCSSIILTTVTDVVGFLAFLGFAVLFQAQLG